MFKCTLSKRKKNETPMFISYLTEMKLVPVIMDYCLLQFGVLKGCS